MNGRQFSQWPGLWVAALVALLAVRGLADEYEGRDATCPDWAKETLPQWVERYIGAGGLLPPWNETKKPVGTSVKGLDFWQANHFVSYRDETAAYLYGKYTPTTVKYVAGTLPTYEKVAAKYTAGLKTDREKAVALLTRALPIVAPHPTIPPLGPKCRADRDLRDEALLQSGAAWCNEQARVFARLCQVIGIPARQIFLFYAEKRGGHAIAEFYAEDGWAMADVSWYCVFPGADGKLMSAAACHERKGLAGKAYFERKQELAKLSDEALFGGRFADLEDAAARARNIASAASRFRRGHLSQTAKQMGEQLWCFGVLNYPLPPAPGAAAAP